MSSSEPLIKLYHTILNEADRLAVPSFYAKDSIALNLDDVLLRLRLWADHSSDNNGPHFLVLMEGEATNLADDVRHDLKYLLELSSALVRMELSQEQRPIKQYEHILDEMADLVQNLARLKRRFENISLKKHINTAQRQWKDQFIAKGQPQSESIDEIPDSTPVLPLSTPNPSQPTAVNHDDSPQRKIFVDARATISPTQPSYVCAQCHLVVASSTDLQRHATETSHTAYACDETGCVESFRSSTELSVHREDHQLGPGFQCPRCHKSFRRRDHLGKHIGRPHEIHDAFLPESSSGAAFPSEPRLKALPGETRKGLKTSDETKDGVLLESFSIYDETPSTVAGFDSAHLIVLFLVFIVSIGLEVFSIPELSHTDLTRPSQQWSISLLGRSWTDLESSSDAFFDYFLLILGTSRQPSWIGSLTQVPGISPFRTSPFVCVVDMAVTILWLTYGSFNGLSLSSSYKMLWTDFRLLSEPQRPEFEITIIDSIIAAQNLMTFIRPIKMFGLVTAVNVPWFRVCSSTSLFLAYVFGLFFQFWGHMKPTETEIVQFINNRESRKALFVKVEVLYHIAFAAQLQTWIWTLIVLGSTGISALTTWAIEIPLILVVLYYSSQSIITSSRTRWLFDLEKSTLIASAVSVLGLFLFAVQLPIIVSILLLYIWAALLSSSQAAAYQSSGRKVHGESTRDGPVKYLFPGLGAVSQGRRLTGSIFFAATNIFFVGLHYFLIYKTRSTSAT